MNRRRKCQTCAWIDRALIVCVVCLFAIAGGALAFALNLQLPLK
jgi:hypothetical protein